MCNIDELPVTAQHRSSYGVSASFSETNPSTKVVTVVTPKTVKWTMTDASGAVVNSRSDIIISPASFVTAPLLADDLDTITDGTVRLIEFVATYDSTIFGLDATIAQQKKLIIDCYIPKK